MPNKQMIMAIISGITATRLAATTGAATTVQATQVTNRNRTPSAATQVLLIVIRLRAWMAG